MRSSRKKVYDDFAQQFNKRIVIAAVPKKINENPKRLALEDHEIKFPTTSTWTASSTATSTSPSSPFNSFNRRGVRM